MSPRPPLDMERLWGRIETLSTYTLTETPWTRRAFSPLFMQARAWLADEFAAAGLNVSFDPAMNLVGARAGRVSGALPLISGSHCDTVVGGGRYDGIIGVLAALEVAQSLDEHGIRLNHPLHVIDFLSEEPSDYGISCIGSRAFSGNLHRDMLEAKSPSGESLAEGLLRIGGQPAAIGAASHPPDSHAGFVELHIEQGPVLEQSGLPIGVVTHIVGIRRFAIEVRGRPDHAGTTPMHMRQDALVAASAIVARTHELARAMGGSDYLVATVGRLHLTPNVPNAVPGFVELVLEVRSDSEALLADFARELMAGCEPFMREQNVVAHMTPLSDARPTACAPAVMDAIAQASSRLALPSMPLPSGAGHDAVYMAPCGPVGMIFIPCLNGRSHCPEESITPEQLRAGTEVLFETILALDKA